MRHPLYFAVATMVALSSIPAHALENYPARLTQKFVSWCSTAQHQPQTVCSCALHQAMVQIPAIGMSSFLSVAARNGVMAASHGVGATALKIVTTCAVSRGTTGADAGNLMNSVGGPFGR
ncbi:MAG: hypothetical protein JKY17_06945 [Magnetovibrio sp.]|nr:hypothetical protein [Magnetovibrio sp.]